MPSSFTRPGLTPHRKKHTADPVPPIYDVGGGRSLAEALAESPLRVQQFLASLSEAEAAALRYRWDFWARPDQRRPQGATKWSTWALMAGRGFGKTRTGAEFVREDINRLRRTIKGHDIRYALVGNAPADIRHVMIEGESGLLACAPPWDRPSYEPSVRQLTWPDGAKAFTYSSEQPGQLRGPQHHGGWIDEFSKFRRPQETLDNFLMGLRLGADPRAIATFTPRNIKAVRELLADPDTIVTGGSTLANRANLPDAVVKRLMRKYGGTRIGRQELAGELIGDTAGALWTLAGLDALRVDAVPVELVRIVIGVDPAGSHRESEAEQRQREADDDLPETGIIVAGLGRDNHVYVIEDKSDTMDPTEWGKRVITAWKHWEADAVVGEVNFGGDMVEHVVRVAGRDAGVTVPFTAVRATRGKLLRAEPVSQLYEQGRVHHVGAWPDLEDQMSTWIPGRKSPDRLDALVWALYALVIDQPDELVYH